jgi:1,4-dihydroxy-6-naphthoate synthase
MKISLGFSPCPNDTFIFDALVNHKIDTGDYEFEVFMEDVETLNQRALQGELMVSKLSFHAGFAADENYILLPAGAAMGFGCGPLLIAPRELSSEEMNTASIALPGKYTTAMLMFSHAFPQASQLKQMIFSDIEQALLSGAADAGVIIHENRFTYEKKGLKKIADLGEYWEQKTGLPLPLGGIFIRKDISGGNYLALSELISQSLLYA